jgi:hypothetical protein
MKPSLALTLAVWLLVGCRAEIQREEIPGTYRAQIAKGLTLRLMRDGTFNYRYWEGNKTVAYDGTWEISQYKNLRGTRVIFSKFCFPSTGGYLGECSEWYAEIFRGWKVAERSKLAIPLDKDGGYREYLLKD